jgi:hypothetical protein
MHSTTRLETIAYGAQRYLKAACHALEGAAHKVQLQIPLSDRMPCKGRQDVAHGMHQCR